MSGHVQAVQIGPIGATPKCSVGCGYLFPAFSWDWGGGGIGTKIAKIRGGGFCFPTSLGGIIPRPRVRGIVVHTDLHVLAKICLFGMLGSVWNIACFGCKAICFWLCIVQKTAMG